MLNPMQIIQTAMNNRQYMQNPIFSNAVGMFKNNDTQGLQKLAENICKERGMSVDQIRKQLGI